MLLSLVFEVLPQERASIPADQGRALMKVFLDWVKQADSSLFDELHKPNHTRPYTVSSLRGQAVRTGGRLLLDPERALWWRITSLEDELTDVLLHIMKTQLPETLRISRQPFHLANATIDPKQHEWAGSASYSDLDAGTTPIPKRLRLEFASPTTFRSDEKNVPFPLPKNVAEQWLKKWNKYSGGEPIPDQILEYAQACLAVSRYEIRSQDVRHGKATYIGFEGSCQYRVLEQHPYWSSKLFSLARFAFYCGTGAKTILWAGADALQITLRRLILRTMPSGQAFARLVER